MPFPHYRHVWAAIPAIALAGLISWSVSAADVPPAVTDPAASDPAVALEQAKFFEQHVRPLLVDKCYKCHGEAKQSGSLRLDTRSAMLAGGDSGPAIAPGEPATSLLIEAVNYESYEMPPDGKLSDEQIAILTKWVSIGAPWPGDDGSAAATRPAASKITDADREYWCFQPLRHPEAPRLADDAWSRTDIDRFILARLRAAELAPQSEADRLTLIRRATQLVIGLPPTLTEIDDFLSDKSPDAYERLVDRLLNSPRRGEHLAQFWLDLVRYAESDGYKQDDYRPDAWRYRDYVIRAFNDDKPYDLFVTEQIAGDELDPTNPDALAATGYFRHGIYEYNQRDAETQWKTMLEDVTDTTADAFLALGMGCAKCHDHKFDPILQSDYYSLQAFFTNLYFHDSVPLATAEQRTAYERQKQEWETATADLRARLDALEQPKLKRLADSAVKMFPAETQAIWNKPAAERTAYEQQIAHLIELQVLDSQAKLSAQFKDAEKAAREQLLQELAQFDALKPAPLPTGRTVTDTGYAPSPVFIPGKSRLGEVEPAFLTVLGDNAPTILPPEAAPSSSGRRTALAQWLARPDHPLTSRVIVNRIWQQMFGTGLVATPSDFGRLGEPPSHPELLDWLATEFVSHGWSLRWLQREILLSATFRQASCIGTGDLSDPRTAAILEAGQRIDPSDRLLWRFPVRRLKAEQIRDAMLAASGQLDLQSGGQGSDPQSLRRSVYLKVLRNRREELLDVFDFPDRITSAGERNITTTPTQSLLMINSDWSSKRAKALADLVTREVASGDDSRIRLAYRLALGRDPSERELLRDAEFLQSRRDRAADQQESDVVTRSMLLTGSAALLVDESTAAKPVRMTDAEVLPNGDFTIEAVVLLKSLYPDATVRTIVSQWDGDTQHIGWSLGVTSQKSAHQPRNLILQLIGQKPDGKTHYEVVPSNLRLELDRPYYVACVVRLTETGPAGVTFYVRDLVSPEGKVQTAQVAHQVTSGIRGDLAMVIGGRDQSPRHRWDGLLDEVRLTATALSADQLLPLSQRTAATAAAVPVSSESIVGYWTFDAAAQRLADDSGHGRTLAVGTAKGTGAEIPLVDLCHVLLNSNEFLYID